MNSTIRIVIFITFFKLCVAANTCPIEAINIGRDLVTKEFKKWDKNCSTLDTFYEKLLNNDPLTEKCPRRGYWFQAQDLYENYSIKCNPDCKNVGKVLGKTMGIAFCKDDVVNTTMKTCNAREEFICGDVFFDYVYKNCNDKRIANEYQNFNKYSEYCNKE